MVNGTGDYAFLLTVTDGDMRRSGESDYDNAYGASDDPNDSSWTPQIIGGGSIVIQAK